MNLPRTFAAVLTLAGLLAPGCARPRPPEFDDVRGVAMITGILVKPREPITTKHVVRLAIRSVDSPRSRDFDVIFGPDPAWEGEATGWFEDNPPRFHVAGCAAIVAGHDPMGETDVVSATAEGSTMIIHLDKRAKIHRVYLLKKKVIGKDKATVLLRANATKRREFEADVDRYVETTPAGDDLLGPYDVHTAPPEIQAFVAQMKARAMDAGIRESDL